MKTFVETGDKEYDARAMQAMNTKWTLLHNPLHQCTQGIFLFSKSKKQVCRLMTHAGYIFIHLDELCKKNEYCGIVRCLDSALPRCFKEVIITHGMCCVLIQLVRD